MEVVEGVEGVGKGGGMYMGEMREKGLDEVV